MSHSQLQKNLPIQLTDARFDDEYSSLKERFLAEMRRIDEEMTNFSTKMISLFGQNSPLEMVASSGSLASSWNNLTRSPLVEGEGNNKKLKLQFDLSHFDPSEVTVQILDNKLVVSGTHEKKTEDSATYRQYHREFLFPRGIDPAAIVPLLSKDGILTVEAPLPALTFEKSAI